MLGVKILHQKFGSVGIFSSHQQAVLQYLLGVLQFSSILIRPGGTLHSIRPHRLRAPSHRTAPATPISPDCYLRFWPTGYKSEVPMTPSSGLINLLEWFTELRETFYFLDHQFITKGYNSGTAQWRSCIKQGMGRGWRASMPSGLTTLFKSMCPPTQRPSEPCLFGVLRRLHYIGMTD